MSYINKAEIIPKDMTGLEDFKFVTPCENTIYVYHNAEHNTPFGEPTKGWLCCTEGWKLKDDGKWHETIKCGWKPDRIVDTIEDIFNCYRI